MHISQPLHITLSQPILLHPDPYCTCTTQPKAHPVHVVCIRPFNSGDDTRAAVVYHRDGLEYRVLSNVTQAELEAAHQKNGSQGYLMIDAAGFRASEDTVLYSGVWQRQAESTRQTRLEFSCSQEVFQQIDKSARKKQYRATAVDHYPMSNGRLGSVQLYDGFDDSLWWLESYWKRASARDLGRKTFTPVDVALAGAVVGNSDGSTDYSMIWHSDARFESESLSGQDVAQMQLHVQELAAQGYRPVAVSVERNAGGISSAAILRKPVVTQTERGRTAKRRAIAALTLLKLGHTRGIWELLEHSPIPTDRSYFIHLARPIGIQAQSLIERLSREEDVSAKCALVLCLGEYALEEIPPKLRDEIVDELIALYGDAPDPGLHSAAQWTLRQWGLIWRCDQIDAALATNRVEGERNWYVNSQQITMVIVPGPREFLMGSPPEEHDRMEHESLHRKRIPRSFAIASKEITVAQWLAFVGENPTYEHDYTRRHSPVGTGPRISLSWYETAAYCNWLNELEKIPPDQWCYEPNADGRYAAGMKVAPDYLHRTGYRLPTEAEWECACRADSTSNRYFGESDELLSEYVWHRA